jgi:hypothetical protein
LFGSSVMVGGLLVRMHPAEALTFAMSDVWTWRDGFARRVVLLQAIVSVLF